MSQFLRSSLFLVITISLTGAAQALELDSVDKRLSYTFGYLYITQFADRGVKIDTDAFSAAVSDVQQGKETRMTKEEMNAEMQAYRKELYQGAQAKADAALETGKLYLDKNRHKPGVKVLPSGLQYMVHRAGEGGSPSMSSKVTVNYRATLIDGTEFDNSYNSPDGPASFELEGVIRGVTEALTLMKPGAK